MYIYIYIIYIIGATCRPTPHLLPRGGGSRLTPLLPPELPQLLPALRLPPRVTLRGRGGGGGGVTLRAGVGGARGGGGAEEGTSCLMGILILFG
jgi:hypothetical protein